MLAEIIHRYRNILFVLGLVIIAMIGFAIYNSLANAGYKSIPVSVVPSDAHIEINGIEAKSGTIALPLGTHTFTVSKDGFATKTTEVVIEKDIDYSKFETITLEPTTEENKKWKEENNELYGEFPELGNNLDPVFSYVPYDSLIYKLESDSEELPITIKASSLGIYKNAPIEYLIRSGIDPSNYKYTFNYKSPFGSTVNE